MTEILSRALNEARAELAALEAQAALARVHVARLELAAQQNAVQGTDLSQKATAPATPRCALPLFDSPVVDRAAETSKMTAHEKVIIFRSLFRGREDVFPRRWMNAKNGRSGYAPACANEWVHGVCEKPRIKCGECPNRRFIQLDDAVIIDHLKGRHVLGVYPLLADDTCWFLAADFDGASWSEDVAAFRDSASAANVPVAIERSRSGDGAHAWVFFDAPVPATLARQLGSLLLTEAMRRRHQMRMSSYDRLFPNQDTTPKGGFGNLIALPLQGEARRQGNTVFLDDSLEPLPDQWEHLRRVVRLSCSRAEMLVADASEAHRIIVVRAPWEATRGTATITNGNVPVEVHATLMCRLSIAKAGLPSPLLREIKNTAAFQNPEFYKRQRLRLYTGETPRVIDCAEDEPERVIVPRGCQAEIEVLLRNYGSVLCVDDQRESGHLAESCSSLKFVGTLRPAQYAAVEDMSRYDSGVLVAPPGSGKTVIGAALIARRNTPTLVLVHSTPIAEQWVAQLTTFLGVTPGMHGAGKSCRTGVIDVAMFPSIIRHGEVKPWVAEYGHVVVDECHHVPAASFERVLNRAHARYLTGLTATPERRDGLHPILQMQLGPIRHTISTASESVRQQLVPTLLVRETGFALPNELVDVSIQTLYGLLAADKTRNDLIFDDVLKALDEGRSPIILTERVDHLDDLAARLGKFTPNLVVLRGGLGHKARQSALTRLAAIPAEAERLILATGRYVGEGFDDPRLDTLFLAMPISWKGRLVQYAGRLHRTQVGKREVRIYDYVDSRIPVLAGMFKRRMRGYRAMGYALA
ncbi:MAG: DEAD/DEAH box helicase family protein [Gemmatimonadaceae bacterium]